ncbi:hypothetical protein G7046_g601 [Stylonectria norvegica]|nr:hypothetical protein G7046_g601 [Stylonectria norvegica]
MASLSEQYLRAHPKSDSISPLPDNLRTGLIIISVFAIISFISTSSLFIYLTYRLAVRPPKKEESPSNDVPSRVRVADYCPYDGEGRTHDYALKVARERRERLAQEAKANKDKKAKKQPPNQILVLLYNLIIADMHQAAAFLISAYWIHKKGIFINTPASFVQGFFDSNGDLASSFFIGSIAIHTIFTMWRGKRPRQRVLYGLIVATWIFVYGLSLIPFLATHNGKNYGGYYVRAGLWCWVNEKYTLMRLLTHYVFIFISLALTTIIYITVVFVLRQKSKMQRARGVGPTQNNPRVNLSHYPVFMIYPIIYVSCFFPLAVGRITTMAGGQVCLAYYCFAGSLIAANGFIDCLLFGITRHRILFDSNGDDEVDNQETGLETFNFMRTPETRYGNIIYIQGGMQPPESPEPLKWKKIRPLRQKEEKNTSVAGRPCTPHAAHKRTVLSSTGSTNSIHMEVTYEYEEEIDLALRDSRNNQNDPQSHRRPESSGSEYWETSERTVVKNIQ